jgi:hypothetical protein
VELVFVAKGLVQCFLSEILGGVDVAGQLGTKPDQSGTFQAKGRFLLVTGTR